MDKCSCVNPESIAGVLKTIYLFLEGQNFHQTCDTFLSESRVMGYAEFKRAMARILVLKPAFTEVVKASQADPSENDRQIQNEVPILLDSVLQETPSKYVRVYYGEPLCLDRAECSISAPALAHDVRPSESKSESKTDGMNVVETIDNTRNVLEAETIQRRAVEDEVRVAPPPPPPEVTESIHSRKDKKINFKRSAQVFIQPETPVTVLETAVFPTSLSTSFPKQFPLHHDEEEEELAEEVYEAEEQIYEPEERTSEPEQSAVEERIIIDKQKSQHKVSTHPLPQVIPKSDSKIERQVDNEEVLLRTEDFKTVGSVASIPKQCSLHCRLASHRQLRVESTRSVQSTQQKSVAKDYIQKPSTTSVRFDIHSRETSTISSKKDLDARQDSKHSMKSSQSGAPEVPSTPAHISTHSVVLPPSDATVLSTTSAHISKQSVVRAPSDASVISKTPGHLSKHSVNAPSGASVASTTPSHVSKHSVKPLPSLASVASTTPSHLSKHSVNPPPSAASVASTTPSHLSQHSVNPPPSAASAVSTTSGHISQHSVVPTTPSYVSARSAPPSADSVAATKGSEGHSAVKVSPSSGTFRPASNASLLTFEANLMDAELLRDNPSITSTIVASQVRLEPSKKSVASPPMSMTSAKASAARSPYLAEEGAIDIASCLTTCGPGKFHSMATTTAEMSCVDSSTEAIETICKSISCLPNFVERSASTGSLRGSCDLDYNRVKKELRSGCPSVRIALLQALRWRLTRDKNDDDRTGIVSDYAKHDLLSLHGTPSGSHRSMVEEFLCARNEKSATNEEEGMARMVNVMASLTLGRDYLCQDENLLTKLIIPLVMDVYPYKAKTTEVTKEHLLVALQKLSLRNNMRVVMIQSGLPEYLVFYLSSRHSRMSDYCLEYCLALFMNLCLHSETRARLMKKSKDVVKFIKDFLAVGHDSCLSYLNSAMYNLFMDADIRKEAKHEHLDVAIAEKAKTVDDETRQQMEVVLDLLNMNKQSTPCVDCGCIDQDDEVDHIEAELEYGDPVKGSPNGEDLLKLYRLKNLSPESTAIPLTCTCRPVTPRKKISASEKCPNPPISQRPHSAAATATAFAAAAASAELDKKKKLTKFCFGLCIKKKEKMSEIPLTAPTLDKSASLTDECPTGVTCCPPLVNDECIPTKEALPSKSDSCSPCLEKSQGTVQRSISRQSVTGHPSGTTVSTKEVINETVQRDPSAVVSGQSSLRELSAKNRTIESLSTAPSKQQSMASRQASVAGRQPSMASRRLSKISICAESEDTCVHKCHSKQPSAASRQSAVSSPSRHATMLCRDPSVASHVSMHDMIEEEPSILSRPSQHSVMQNEAGVASCHSLHPSVASCHSIHPCVMSCHSRQPSAIKSASCASFAGDNEPVPYSKSVISTLSPKSTSRESLLPQPSVSRSVINHGINTQESPTSKLNMVQSDDKGIQHSSHSLAEKKSTLKSCMKCCVAKPKKKDSRMSANLESEVTIEEEFDEPLQGCSYVRELSDKSVATINESTISRGVLARDPSTNGTRPMKCTKDGVHYCNDTHQCLVGHRTNVNCGAFYGLPPCQTGLPYTSSSQIEGRTCPHQPTSRYPCDCYSSIKLFVENGDENEPRSYRACQQPHRNVSIVEPYPSRNFCSSQQLNRNFPSVEQYPSRSYCSSQQLEMSPSRKNCRSSQLLGRSVSRTIPRVESCASRKSAPLESQPSRTIPKVESRASRNYRAFQQLDNHPRRNPDVQGESDEENDKENDEENDEEDGIPTPEKEFHELESALKNSDIFCEISIYPSIDCECYESVFQSRPKLTRTP